ATRARRDSHNWRENTPLKAAAALQRAVLLLLLYGQKLIYSIPQGIYFLYRNGHALLSGLFFLVFIEIPLTDVQVLATGILADVDVDRLTARLFVHRYSLFCCFSQGRILRAN